MKECFDCGEWSATMANPTLCLHCLYRRRLALAGMSEKWRTMLDPELPQCELPPPLRSKHLRAGLS